MEILPEVEVWYGLPAIRRKLAEELKAQGISQKAVAEKLHLTQSAVSQYLSGKRGTSTIPKKLDDAFTQAATRIADGNEHTLIKEQLRLSNLLKSSRAICDIHREHADLPENCSTCFE